MLPGEEQIQLDNIDIWSPDTQKPQKLFSNLLFNIKPKQHTIICGPNGIGKTSLFRIIARLWPVFGGVLHLPDVDDLFFVSQVTYIGLTV